MHSILSSTKFGKFVRQENNAALDFLSSVVEGNSTNSVDFDKVYLHILKCLSALSLVQAKDPLCNAQNDNPLNSKRRIFWLSVEEIANSESSLQRFTNRPLYHVLHSLVLDNGDNDNDHDDDQTEKSWLALNFGVASSYVECGDVDLVLNEDPTRIKAAVRSLTPCHLAAMANKPNLMKIECLEKFWPESKEILWPDPTTGFLSSVNVLGLAAQYTSNCEMIEKLMKLEPPNWTTYGQSNTIPIPMIFRNSSTEAPLILETVLKAAPVGFNLMDVFILRDILTSEVSPQFTTMLAVVLERCPALVDVLVFHSLPIHIAAERCPLEVFRLIHEANPANLGRPHNRYGSVAHLAARGDKLDNLRFIHSVMPELLYSVDNELCSPVQIAVRTHSSSELIDLAISLAPETAVVGISFTFTLCTCYSAMGRRLLTLKEMK